MLCSSRRFAFAKRTPSAQTNRAYLWLVSPHAAAMLAKNLVHVFGGTSGLANGAPVGHLERFEPSVR